MTDHEELPPINWHAKLAPSLDRRDQLRLYSEAMGREAAMRQVRLTREALPKRKRKAN